MTSSPKLDRNLPVLDGMRAVSILLVLFSHAGLQHIVPGGLGVVIFFVISGFLITRLMLEEMQLTGDLSIRLFYIRRILRLMPTVVLFMAVAIPALLLLNVTVTAAQVASVLFYVTNYYHIYIEYPSYNPFPIFWSLAVEEHFYIIFPFLIWVLRKHLGVLAGLLIALAGIILAWRFHLNALCLHGPAPWAVCGVTPQLDMRIYHGTDSIADCILFGVLLSLALHLRGTFVRKYFVNNVAFYLGGAGLLFTLVWRDPDFRETVRYTLQAASIAVILLNLVYGRQAFFQRILQHRLLLTIGQWSYALYMFHYLVLVLIERTQGHAQGLEGPLDVAIYFAGSFALAGAAHIFLEKPLQKVRRRFHPHAIVLRNPKEL
ncbi:MAG: acyltransferase [Alphaproteobacteria bacterium]|nr:acyltransferase [Alphaproteobacteria bacterium]